MGVPLPLVKARGRVGPPSGLGHRPPPSVAVATAEDGSGRHGPM
jgi:hypothetical protein